MCRDLLCRSRDSVLREEHAGGKLLKVESTKEEGSCALSPNRPESDVLFEMFLIVSLFSVTDP